jgi:hypothetical protein
MDDHDHWIAIKSAWEAGGDAEALSIGRASGIRAIEIIAKIRDWKAAPDPDPDPDEKGGLPVISKRDSVADAPSSPEEVTESHRVIAAKSRALFDLNLSGNLMMAGYVNSFVDIEAMEEYRLECADKGDMMPFLKRMEGIARMLRDATENGSKLSRSGKDVMEMERVAWALDKLAESDADQYDWEAIQAEISKPLEPLKLPNNVIEFERKINKSRIAE